MDIVKITPALGLLGRMNNAEYANFMSVVQALVNQATIESLGIASADFEAFERNVQVMTDIVVQTRALAETEQLAALDSQRDALLTFIFNTVRTAVNFPVLTQRDAAVEMGLIVAPYVGMQRHPLRQETQEIDALLMDIAKLEDASSVTALALDAAFASLADINKQFRKLDVARSQKQADNTLDEARSFRRTINKQYDDLTTVAFANSVVNPSEATQTFVAMLNKHIDEARALYNQRIAQAKRNETPTP